MPLRCQYSTITLVCLSLLSAASDLAAQNHPDAPVETEELDFVTEIKHEALQRPASVAVSRDGKFIYSAGYGAPSCLVVRHDRESETLEHVQTVEDHDRLQATVSLRLSNDDRFAVAASIASSAVSLFSRDPSTGRLTMLDSKSPRTDSDISGMDFTVEASFTHDDRFVNVLDDTGGVTAFRVVGDGNDRKLEFADAIQSTNLQGARGLAHHPFGHYLFVACKKSRSIVAMKQDPKLGTLEILDIKSQEHDGVRGLHSAFGVTVSRSGDYVYSVSGHGHPIDNAVCVFRFDPFEKKLNLIEDVYPAEIELDGITTRFHGGNEVRVNKNHLYACATTSGTIAAFERNSLTGKIKLTSIKLDRIKHGWPNGLAISPDGNYLYVACDNKTNSICVLRLTP